MTINNSSLQALMDDKDPKNTFAPPWGGPSALPLSVSVHLLPPQYVKERKRKTEGMSGKRL